MKNNDILNNYNIFSNNVKYYRNKDSVKWFRIDKKRKTGYNS